MNRNYQDKDININCQINQSHNNDLYILVLSFIMCNLAERKQPIEIFNITINTEYNYKTIFDNSNIKSLDIKRSHKIHVTGNQR